MNLTENRDDRYKITNIAVAITDAEFLTIFNRDDMIRLVRDQLATRLADHVMSRLGPRPARVLHEEFSVL